jgi:hypothetical protein
MLQFSFMHSGYVLHVLCFELLMLHQISIYRWLQPNAKHLHLVALAPSEGEEGPKAVRYAELHCKTHARGPRTRPCTPFTTTDVISTPPDQRAASSEQLPADLHPSIVTMTDAICNRVMACLASFLSQLAVPTTVQEPTPPTSTASLVHPPPPPQPPASFNTALSVAPATCIDGRCRSGRFAESLDPRSFRSILHFDRPLRYRDNDCRQYSLNRHARPSVLPHYSLIGRDGTHPPHPLPPP